MRQSRIEDVLEVLKEVKHRYTRSGGSTNISEVRKEAIESIAQTELNSRRFKNRNSAVRTIHDACTRRLRKIGNISDFDFAVKEWLNGKPSKIRQALEFEIRTGWEKDLISKFFSESQSISKNSTNDNNKVARVSENESENSSPIASDINEPSQPERVKQETYRILRDTSLSRKLKQEKWYQCEICGEALKISESKPYAEVHHIKPLGNPHNGPDIRGNLLCLCPNHHVLLDYGAIKLDAEQFDDVDSKYIDYHNTHIFGKV